MSTKEAYTADEWAAVMTAPVMAGAYITMADPGVTSLFSEASAMMKAMATGEVPVGATELVGSIVAEMKAMSERGERMDAPDFGDEAKKDPAAAKAALMAKVTAGTDAVAANGGADEAKAYKQWIMGVAQATAEASKEGGFMGIGGVRVSDDEKAALAELGASMGI